MNNNNDLLPISTPDENAYDAASMILSAVPHWIAPPISAFFQGKSLDRKMKRVKKVIEEMTKEIGDFKTLVSEKYLQTDDFQDLFEHTI